jgi:ATP-dependent DNA helicase RecQ
MSEIYNAGACLQYVWEMRAQLGKTAESECHLDARRRTLATFTLARFPSPDRPGQASLSDKDRHIVAVLTNLLQRGLPTFSSLGVERTLLQSLPAELRVIEDKTGSGAFRFSHGNLNRQREFEWREALVQAHIPVDPRLRPDQRDPATFDSDAERLFYGSILPRAVGELATLLFEPQRPMASILDNERAAGFVDQRVDFAIEMGDVRRVFEIDGSQHLAAMQEQLDTNRVAAADSLRWRTYHIPAAKVADRSTLDELHRAIPQNHLLDRVAALQGTPLWGTAIGKAALRLVLVPFAVARIQRCLLLALAEGRLRLGQDVWRIVIVERDVRCAALAVTDFLEQLSQLCELQGRDVPLPNVELRVYYTAEFADAALALDSATRAMGVTIEQHLLTSERQDYFDGDLVLDVAMLQPEGFVPLDPAFANRHLTTTGVAYEVRSALHAEDKRQVTINTPRAYPWDQNNSPRCLHYFLQSVFRKAEFLDRQIDILERALTLKPVIGLLPTGGGKSLCYQMAALLQPGVTLVVGPLISLMIDQVDNLREKLAIDWIEYINSQLTTEERRQAQDDFVRGRRLILFISPERLQGREFRDRLVDMRHYFPVVYAVIDEAHCVSEWGHDFRTSYLKLASTIRKHCEVDGRAPAMIALTGTASFSVLSDVQREIGVEDESAKVYPKSFDRPNLSFGINQVASHDKRTALYWELDTLPRRFRVDPDLFYQATGDDNTYAGIVFVPHANGDYSVTRVQGLLEQQLDTCVRIFSGQAPKIWNGGRSFDAYKLETQRLFKENLFPILVATKAFGMGIDKPNIRYTIHYNIAQSLEAFYQEAGRAGRDRSLSYCWMILSDDRPDRANQALSPDATREQITAAAHDGRHAGDAQRLLFLHERSYPGVKSEWKWIYEIFRTYLWPLIGDAEYNVSLRTTIPFGSDDDRGARDKALYRLSILGSVEDYTLDHHTRVFDVIAVKRPDTEYIDRLRTYIARYKTREVADAVATAVEQEEGATILGKCASYLLRFVYNEIERKRRVAIRSMLEVARRAANITDEHQASEFIRGELLAYLEESPFTEPLAQLARRLNPQEWVDLLQLKDETCAVLLRSVDGARQLLGGCRRTLESYPDHPGLLFLSSLARLLLPNPEYNLALEEVRDAFAELRDMGEAERIAAAKLLWSAYHEWLKNTRDYERERKTIIQEILQVLPMRVLARHFYTFAPDITGRVLLSLLFTDLHSLAQRLTKLEDATP